MGKWQVSNREEIILENNSQEFDYRKVLDKLLQRWGLFLISITIAVVIAFLANRYTTPIYVVNASVLIKAEKEVGNAVSDLLYDDEFFGRNATNLENESSLIKSYALIEKTLRDLKLNVSYFKEGKVRDEELYEKSPIQVNLLSTQRAPYGTLFKVTVLSDSTFGIQSIDESTFFESFLDKVGIKEKEFVNLRSGPLVFGEPVTLGHFKFAVDYIGMPNKKYHDQILFRISNYNSLTKSYRNNLKASAASIESSIINLSMEGAMPQKVKDFMNTLIQNYIDNELDLKNFTAQRTIEFIESQIGYTGDSLRSVEDRLENFRREKNVNLSTEGTKLSNALGSLGDSRSRLNMTIKYLEDQRSYLASNNYDQLIAPSSMGIDDSNLNRLVGELISLQSEIRIMESDKGLDNPLIGLKQQKMESLKISVLDNIRSLLATNRYRVETIESQIAGVRASMRNLPTAERQLIDIQRTQSLNEDLYIFLMQKKFEAGIAKSSNAPDYRVVNDARIQGMAPVKPSPSLNYAMALFLGLVIPTLLIFGYDLINNKISSKSELSRITQIPIIGQIAHYDKKIKGSLITTTAPRSAVSESFRNIRSNLRYLMNGKATGKVFLLTSSISGEGKSFCSNNLAYIFSNFGKKVVLVNADMRKTFSYDEFGIQAEAGLSDYLANIADRQSIVHPTLFPNLDLITAGGIPPNPSELLINGRFEGLLNELRQNYDYIVLDTPPVGLIADGLELMHMADVNLFIVRQGYTLKSFIQEANEMYAKSDIPNFAILYNDVKYHASKYGYGYYQEDEKRVNLKKVLVGNKPRQAG